MTGPLKAPVEAGRKLPEFGGSMSGLVFEDFVRIGSNLSQISILCPDPPGNLQPCGNLSGFSDYFSYFPGIFRSGLQNEI